MSGKGKTAWEDDHYDDDDEYYEEEEEYEEEEDLAMAQKKQEAKKAAAAKANQAKAAAASKVVSAAKATAAAVPVHTVIVKPIAVEVEVVACKDVKGDEDQKEVTLVSIDSLLSAGISKAALAKRAVPNAAANTYFVNVNGKITTTINTGKITLIVSSGEQANLLLAPPAFTDSDHQRKIKESNRKQNYDLSAELFGDIKISTIAAPSVTLGEGKTLENFEPSTEQDFEVLAAYMGAHLAAKQTTFYYRALVKGILKQALANVPLADIDEIDTYMKVLHSDREKAIAAARAANAPGRTRADDYPGDFM